MKFKLWIATNGDGEQLGFIYLPIRNVCCKFWTLDEPGDWFNSAIVLSQFNLLPDQTWEDEPVLVEFSIGSE